MAKLVPVSGTLVTLLTTDLNSLANGAGSALSAVYDNSNTAGNGYLEAEFEFTTTFSVNPTNDSAIEIYIIRSIDGGTNYADYTSGTTPVVSIGSSATYAWVKATTSAQRVISPRIALPVDKFKVAVVNRTGQALPSSGSVLRMRPVRLETVA